MPAQVSELAAAPLSRPQEAGMGAEEVDADDLGEGDGEGGEEEGEEEEGLGPQAQVGLQ